MPQYYVNDRPQPDSGDHEVHQEGCYWLTQASSTTALGFHQHCATAVTAAKRIYPDSNGCKHCSSSCHTS